MSTFTFNEFFESGMDESVSPFLTPNSRKWGKHLSLKVALLSAGLLASAYVFSFFPTFFPLSGLLLLLTYFFAGIPALINSIEDIVRLRIDINVLMTLAAFGSIAIGSEKEGALLLVLFALSGAMEEMVTSKAKGAVSQLKKIAPSKAHVISDSGVIYQKAIQEIAPGTKILVKTGEIIPLDGKILSGEAFVNSIHLTGENLPQTKTTGDEVYAGSVTLDSSLTIEVTKPSSDSALMRIITLITEATLAKPKLQRWLDKMSKRYAITIIGSACAFALFLPQLFSIPYIGREGSIYRALAFLIACSPCALLIAIPIAYFSSLAASARKGILLKGGVSLETLAKCSCLALDKTGTLTTGELSCLGIIPFSNAENMEQAILLAASLEAHTTHPIATAVLAFCETKELLPIEKFQTIPGKGVTGEWENQKLLLGKPEWILPLVEQEEQEKAAETIHRLQQKGEIVSLFKKGENLFLFHFKDRLRPNVETTLNILKEKFDFELWMLTGDHSLSAERIAREVGIEKVHANLNPEDKLSIITDIMQKKELAMVGDGINDAPSLARATVGIAMGKVGSNITTDVADIVLLQDNIEHLPWLLGKAKKTERIIKQNLLLALSVMVFVTFPALFGIIPLWLAVILHEGGTLIVGLNSLRLLKH